MLARNVEQPAGILEKGVMMVTDVGVEIGVRAGKGILCTIAAVRHQRNQVVATLLLLNQQSMSRSAGTVLVENNKTTLSAPR